MPQRICSNPQNNFKAVRVDAIDVAIVTQLTIWSTISKNCNRQQSIAGAIEFLRPLFRMGLRPVI